MPPGLFPSLDDTWGSGHQQRLPVHVLPHRLANLLFLRTKGYRSGLSRLSAVMIVRQFSVGALDKAVWIVLGRPNLFSIVET
jgi:hypothetical protein